jgi:GNAT superfamily N-acetyltransferase
VNLVLRRAGAADAAAAADVYIRARHAAAGTGAIPPMAHDEDDTRRYWRDALVPKVEVWLAEDAGDVVAVMALDGEWLDQLYVAPGRTSAGIGTALLDLAKERRPAGLRLWAFQSNTGARRFYERHGFVEIDSTDGDNEEHAPDVLYAWSPSDGN